MKSQYMKNNVPFEWAYHEVVPLLVQAWRLISAPTFLIGLVHSCHQYSFTQCV